MMGGARIKVVSVCTYSQDSVCGCDYDKALQHEAWKSIDFGY